MYPKNCVVFDSFLVNKNIQGKTNAKCSGLVTRFGINPVKIRYI